MKKVLLLAVMVFSLFGAVKAQEQEIQLTAADKQELMDDVTGALKGLIANFGGTYKPGTSIDHMYQVSDTEARIEGMVNYIGEKCGDVRTRYEVTIIVEGSNVYARPAIYTPYCWLGQIIRYEWDDTGRRQLLGNGNGRNEVPVAQIILELLMRSR